MSTQEARAETGSQVSDRDEVVHELGHDEFSPVGTATLVFVYFLMLVGLWVFMYFVEFLGRGPTVVG